jgi:hypothetical protein
MTNEIARWSATDGRAEKGNTYNQQQIAMLRQQPGNVQGRRKYILI